MRWALVLVLLAGCATARLTTPRGTCHLMLVAEGSSQCCVAGDEVPDSAGGAIVGTCVTAKVWPMSQAAKAVLIAVITTAATIVPVFF